MERPSSGTVFPVVRSPDCDSRNGGSAETIGKGNPFPGNGFHERRPDCGSPNGGSAERAGEGKTNPAGWFSMSGQKAAGELRDALVLPAHGAGIRIVTYGLWTRFETRVSLIPALAGIKEGISRPAGHDSGQRCPRVRALAERVGHSLAGKRPTGAFSDSARFEKGLSESFN